MKICTECKHFKGMDNAYMASMVTVKPDAECLHPHAATRDPIYGKALCHNERTSTGKACGKQGKLWESKSSEKKS